MAVPFKLMGAVGQGFGLGRREVFPRRMRVRKRREFLRIQASPRRASGRHLMLMVQAQVPGASTPYPLRLGITVSRKIGNAVVRNRVKRWLRESFRRQVAALGERAQGMDLVVIARPSVAAAGFAETQGELVRLLGRLFGNGG